MTESPDLTRISVIFPEAVAKTSFSIFMASSNNTRSPLFTESPTLTLTFKILPGIGAVTVIAPSATGAGAAGASGAGVGAGAGAAGAAGAATGAGAGIADPAPSDSTSTV